MPTTNPFVNDPNHQLNRKTEALVRRIHAAFANIIGSPIQETIYSSIAYFGSMVEPDGLKFTFTTEPLKTRADGSVAIGASEGAGMVCSVEGHFYTQDQDRAEAKAAAKGEGEAGCWPNPSEFFSAAAGAGADNAEVIAPDRPLPDRLMALCWLTSQLVTQIHREAGLLATAMPEEAAAKMMTLPQDCIHAAATHWGALTALEDARTRFKAVLATCRLDEAELAALNMTETKDIDKDLEEACLQSLKNVARLTDVKFRTFLKAKVLESLLQGVAGRVTH